MEIYSPKKFQSASFSNNTLVKKESRPIEDPDIAKVKIEPRVIKKATVVTESLPDRMRRVFYERLRAFFEYEEVS